MRRAPGSRVNTTGATSGNSPAGPFVRTAAATENPEIAPQPHAARRELANAAPSAAASAAVVNNDIVVSSRLPTIDHETTGTAIHKRIGSHSSRRRRHRVGVRPSPDVRPAAAARLTAINTAVAAATATV